MNTLSGSNEARIKCPSLGVVAKVADCSSFRDRVWRGERPDERRGCQACMSASKCAIAQVIHDMRLGTSDPGLYSPTEKVMALDAKLLDRMSRIVVPDKTLDKFLVPDDERMAIANAKAAVAIDTSDWGSTAPAPRKRRVKAESSKPETTADAIVDAAASGDLSAAISRAAEKSKAGPAPKPVEAAPKPQPKPAALAPTAGMSLLERARLAKQGKAA